MTHALAFLPQEERDNCPHRQSSSLFPPPPPASTADPDRATGSPRSRFVPESQAFDNPTSQQLRRPILLPWFAPSSPNPPELLSAGGVTSPLCGALTVAAAGSGGGLSPSLLSASNSTPLGRPVKLQSAWPSPNLVCAGTGTQCYRSISFLSAANY